MIPVYYLKKLIIVPKYFLEALLRNKNLTERSAIEKIKDWLQHAPERFATEKKRLGNDSLSENQEHLYQEREFGDNVGDDGGDNEDYSGDNEDYGDNAGDNGDNLGNDDFDNSTDCDDSEDGDASGNEADDIDGSTAE